MDNRQKQLLKVIVETYVKSVKPVGSKSLCEKFNFSSIDTAKIHFTNNLHI